MFRRWLSSFWNNNKSKIFNLAKVLGLVILLGFAFAKTVGMLVSSDTTNTASKEAYTPEQTVILGTNISEEKFEEQNSLVKSFVDYCNEQNYEEAYNLLTEDCKEKIYPSLSDFENKYCKRIFTEKREYNLQSWINNGKYNTYRVRFTGDIIGNGSYDNSENYEDYITIVTNDEGQKLNINGYIKTEEINKETKNDKIQAVAKEVDTYMDYVTYKVSIKNISENDILLDELNTKNDINLIGTNSSSYKLSSNNLMQRQLLVTKNMRKDISLTFNKQYGSDVRGSYIEFSNVIEDYNEYKENNDSYEKYIKIIIYL